MRACFDSGYHRREAIVRDAVRNVPKPEEGLGTNITAAVVGSRTIVAIGHT
jgi:hypothetical protein